jgi:hypothetical protein
MTIRELLGLTIVVAICFFLLAGAGIFTFWFWLNVF